MKPEDAPDALRVFSPAVVQWFERSFPHGPTDIQVRTWAKVSQGANVLTIAPTGSGKTLAAFLWAIDELLREKTFGPLAQASGKEGSCEEQQSNESAGKKKSSKKRSDKGVRILYISPMKALGADVERNLERPLRGIAMGDAELTVGMRTGDTTAAERRRLATKPPDILITTPESLYLMLTSKARDILRTVRTVIVDEVHVLAGSKRGSHLALSL